MKRTLIFLYGVLSYAFFFATFLYSIGFIGNIGVPKSIDSAPILPLGISLLINLGLLILFAVQHSGMARPAFKRWLTKFIPQAAERSTYVLLSTLCLAILMAFWAPLGGVIWDVSTPWAAWTLTGLYFASWGLLLYATFLIDHFDLFGLRQVFYALRDQEAPQLEFKTRTLYRIVRHPIYVGWLGIMWFSPTMTVTHFGGFGPVHPGRNQAGGARSRSDTSGIRRIQAQGTGPGAEPHSPPEGRNCDTGRVIPGWPRLNSGPSLSLCQELRGLSYERR